jgi:putative membrane protein
MFLVRRALTAGAAAALAGLALAPPAGAQPTDQDTSWMVAAHQSNLAEIAAGTAAREHGTTEAVQNMGLVLVEEHQTLDAGLTAAAEQLGVELPTAPSAEQQAALEAVMAEKGEAFDTAWIASQIEGHRMTLAAGQEEIVSGSDPTVIALAEEAGPIVQSHLDSLLEMSGGTPGAVPSGLGDNGAGMLGAGLIGVGAVALVASLMLALRRGRVRA